MGFQPSELILNADNSVYHLNLIPEDLSHTIITVGDPERVPMVSRHFDSIEIKKAKREFHTHTGTIGNKPITVISTGIGTDNIDIVLNELDALVNIDFDSRTIKTNKTILDIVRIGTSGALLPEIPLDSYLYSEYALGLDGLIHYYESEHIQHPEIQAAFVAHTRWPDRLAAPYVVACHPDLAAPFRSAGSIPGFTVTNTGFYGPQGRQLRLSLQDKALHQTMASFNYKGKRITNLEMETSGLYGLSQLLGHRALSLNCIIANRSTGRFSPDPEKAMEGMIEFALEKIIEN